jgi:DNA-binding transcriptional LysR family regulator
VLRSAFLGQLAAVLPQFRSIELGIYAVYPSRRHGTARVRLMIDFSGRRPHPCLAKLTLA